MIADARHAAYAGGCTDRLSISCTAPSKSLTACLRMGALGFVTPRQLEVLIAVSEDDGCNLTAVIERTGIDRSTTTDLVQRLVRRRLLQKRRSRQDTRTFVLKLTKEGSLLLAAAEPVARNLDAALLQALAPAQREPFMKALRAVVRALEGR